MQTYIQRLEGDGNTPGVLSSTLGAMQTRGSRNKSTVRASAEGRRPDTLSPDADTTMGTTRVTPQAEDDQSMDDSRGSENGAYPPPGSMQRNDDGTVAGTGGLEHLVPRWVAQEVLSTETAYEEPKSSVTELLLELQSRDALAVSLKQKVTAGTLRNAGVWQVDPQGLLRHQESVYVPGD